MVTIAIEKKDKVFQNRVVAGSVSQLAELMAKSLLSVVLRLDHVDVGRQSHCFIFILVFILLHETISKIVRLQKVNLHGLYFSHVFTNAVF